MAKTKETEKAIKSEDLKNQLNHQRLEEAFRILSEKDIDITEESTMRQLLRHHRERQARSGISIQMQSGYRGEG